MKKDKLLRRLSAMQFAMWEMREFLDTHPNCPDATALYNAYKEKYDTLAKEYEARFGPLVLNGANSDDWLQDPGLGKPALTRTSKKVPIIAEQKAPRRAYTLRGRFIFIY